MWLALVMAFSIQASADVSKTGFEVGSKIVFRSVAGTAWAQCPHSYSRYVSCRTQDVQPDWQSTFVGPQYPNANRVEFSRWEDGQWKVRRKEDYDGALGRTRKPVDLFQGSIFGKDFLKLGTTRVQWRLLDKENKDQELDKGELEMITEQAPPLFCPTGTVYLYTDMYCRDDYVICSQYFRQVWNFCH